MAIQPSCDAKMCGGKELGTFGALLFGPRGNGRKRKKSHICLECYPELRKAVEQDGELQGFPRTAPYLLSAPDNHDMVIELDMTVARYELIVKTMLRR